MVEVKVCSIDILIYFHPLEVNKFRPLSSAFARNFRPSSLLTRPLQQPGQSMIDAAVFPLQSLLEAPSRVW